MHITAYSPLGSPDSASIQKREDSKPLMKDPELLKIAEKHGKNPAQVLISWAIQHGTSVIPKSTGEDHLKVGTAPNLCSAQMCVGYIMHMIKHALL